MGASFHESVVGRKFLEGTVPNGIAAINRLAAAIEKQNELTGGTADQQAAASKSVIFVCYETDPAGSQNLKHFYATSDPEKAMGWFDDRLQNAYVNGCTAMSPGYVASAKGNIRNSCGSVNGICITAPATKLYSYSICVRIQVGEEA